MSGLEVRLTKFVDHAFTLDVAWDVTEGFLVLFGFSGSGKSVTLKLIAGLGRPDAGMIRCDGAALFDHAAGIDVPCRTRPLGYCAQHPALFPHMTVLENLEYALPGVARDERAARVEEWTRTLALGPLAHKSPAQLSGGQKQRVSLARALVRRPRALLLDEPFSALDNPVRLELRELLRDVQARLAIPVVMVTHDFLEAYQTADRLAVYENGRVSQIGVPDEVVFRPATPGVERLVGIRRFFRLSPGFWKDGAPRVRSACPETPMA